MSDPIPFPDPKARTISVPASRAAGLLLQTYQRIRRTGMSIADVQILLCLAMHARPHRACEIREQTSCSSNLIRQRARTLEIAGVIRIDQVHLEDSNQTRPTYTITRAGMDRIRGILAINHENRIQLPAAK